MRFAIVGCGFIGEKRAASLTPGSEIVGVADIDQKRAKSLADHHNAKCYDDWRAAINDSEVEVVIVATVHSELATIALAAVEAGKHVLLEKPGARSPAELEKLQEAALINEVQVHVGFNHRFHPAMIKAREIVDSGALGPIYFVRGRYGHGGRKGYDEEWRAKPEVSGGGELLDQGAHLIDLSRWFIGDDFQRVSSEITTYFWNMPVEDNAFLTLATGNRQVAQLSVSWTEWKNLFCLEITGRNGKLEINGLGGSYGTERLAFYKMKPEMGPPETTIYEYPGPDTSWRAELEHFLSRIRDRRNSEPNLQSTARVLSIIEQVYRDHDVAWLASENPQ
ncbi:MAG: Gfo/Idh/MocA family oxidoreductase [Pseudomonadota bacterium]